VHNASSSHYTLTVMTWVALIFTPVVLAYQGWTYWVFRRRVTGAPLTPPASPAAGPVTHAPSGP
jgi:cytochrome bd ubiquinol oxidase subunit II